MCVNYTPVSHSGLKDFNAHVAPDAEWPKETWQDYMAPVIRRGSQGDRETILGSYGMVPKRKIPPHVKKYTTMNARAESVSTLRSYSTAWREGNLCLIPMTRFYEPNWETGDHIRFGICMADDSPFAVAGLWRAWQEEDGSDSYSFTQITINADEHPLMKRFHKSGSEKRSLVIVPNDEYDAWLDCKNPEEARSFLNPYPAELMKAFPAPKEVKNG